MKFFKRGLAILTSAAVLSSGFCITAYAKMPEDNSFVVPEGLKIINEDGNELNMAESDGLFYWGSLGYGHWVILKADKDIIVTITGMNENDPGITVDSTNKRAVKFTVHSVSKLTGNEKVTVSLSDGNAVWINGKDVRDNKKTESVDETKLYKTYKYSVTGMYSGGKWQVCVTDPEKIDTVDALVSELNKYKGKLGKEEAAAGKLLASAKIKDGVVTVTAGKGKADLTDTKANVWVYEVKKGADPSDTTGKKNGVVKTTGDKAIAPKKMEIGVKIANANPTFIDAKGNAVKSVELSDGEEAIFTIGSKDAKKGIASADNTYVKDDKTKDADVVINSDGTVKVTGKGKKGTVVLKCVQSGKTFRLAVTAPKASSSSGGSGGGEGDGGGGGSSSDTAVSVPIDVPRQVDKNKITGITINGNKVDMARLFAARVKEGDKIAVTATGMTTGDVVVVTKSAKGTDGRWTVGAVKKDDRIEIAILKEATITIIDNSAKVWQVIINGTEVHDIMNTKVLTGDIIEIVLRDKTTGTITGTAGVSLVGGTTNQFAVSIGATEAVIRVE